MIREFVLCRFWNCCIANIGIGPLPFFCFYGILFTRNMESPFWESRKMTNGNHSFFPNSQIRHFGIPNRTDIHFFGIEIFKISESILKEPLILRLPSVFTRYFCVRSLLGKKRLSTRKCCSDISGRFHFQANLHFYLVLCIFSFAFLTAIHV